MQEGQRKIPVQYAKRVVGRRVYGGQSTHIPLRINTAGVIPVIFASSLILFPATLTRFVPHPWMQAISDALALPPDRCVATYPFLGNVGPAAVPITLAHAVAEGKLLPGDRAALMGIGSGLNVSMMAVTW